MRLTVLGLALLTTTIGGFAQDWELGGTVGYGWAHDSSTTGGAIAVNTGQVPRGAFSIFLDENLYKYLGGEIQYVFRDGGTQVKSNGIDETASGYSNIVVYNLVIHMTPYESKFRPFVGVGSGIKVYTNSSVPLDQPLAGIATMTRGTHVEPALSFDGGLKFRFRRHAQLRMDLRVYASPTPDRLIRPVYPSHIRGWIFDFVPMAGMAYVF